MKRLVTLFAFAIACFLVPPAALAQNPKIVTAAQANGVYSSYDNEIRILALGKNKLKVQFDGVYHTISKSVNTGYASGEATIEGNVAVLELREWGPCKITMVWLRGNRLKVTQEGDSPDCGFGHNVRADGTYRKIRGGKPNLVDEQIARIRAKVETTRESAEEMVQPELAPNSIQAMILNIINQHPGFSMKELLYYSPWALSTLSRRLRELQDMGLVEKRDGEYYPTKPNGQSSI